MKIKYGYLYEEATIIEDPEKNRLMQSRINPIDCYGIKIYRATPFIAV